MLALEVRETPTVVKGWVGCLVVLVIAATVVVGGVLIVIRGMSHFIYEVEGSVRVGRTLPTAVTLPAVVCMRTGYQGEGRTCAVHGTDEQAGAVYLVCELPREGIGIPFKTSQYSNSSHGIEVAAYLRSLLWDHPSCGAAESPVVLVPDEDRSLDRLCSNGELPPETDIAVVKPFGSEAGKRTESLEIVVTRAE